VVGRACWWNWAYPFRIFNNIFINIDNFWYNCVAMKNVKAAILDDEISNIEILKRILLDCENVEIVWTADNLDDAFGTYRKGKSGCCFYGHTNATLYIFRTAAKNFKYKF
jgi:hypothetical protein